MSRLGKLPIALPSGVKAVVAQGAINIEGPKGKLSFAIPAGIEVSLKDNQIVSQRKDDSAEQKALHGLTRATLANFVKGCAQGFERKLTIHGTGYRAAVKGQTLGLTVGYSHPVDFPLPTGVAAKVDGNTTVILSSADKALLGDTAAKIRAVRPPEPYQGKGIRYADEHIRRKAGKAAAK